MRTNTYIDDVTLRRFADVVGEIVAERGPDRGSAFSIGESAAAKILALLEQCLDERVALHGVLHDVTVIANEAKTIDGAFRRVLRLIAEHNGWCYGHVYIVSHQNPNVLTRARAFYEDQQGRFDAFTRTVRRKRLERGEGLPGRVWASGEAAWEGHVERELSSRGLDRGLEESLATAAAFPASVDGNVMAVFEFLSEKALPKDPGVLESMSAIGRHLGLFIVRKQMKRRIAGLTTAEQSRIGRDLHDDLGQQLTGLALLAKSLERDLNVESSKHAARVHEISSGLKRAHTHVRMLARGIAPVQIDADGLPAALRELATTSSKRLGIQVDFVPAVEVGVRDRQIATELYRIAQEALTNAAKHGKPSLIEMKLLANDDDVTLEILDNGIGVSDQTIRRLGMGLSTMVYRASVIGGELTVGRGAPEGTLVRCCVPNEDEVPDAEYTHV